MIQDLQIYRDYLWTYGIPFILYFDCSFIIHNLFRFAMH